MVGVKNRVIGILGGGQLAQMTINAAHNLGFKVHVFSDSENAIAFHNADFKTCAKYEDIKQLMLSQLLLILLLMNLKIFRKRQLSI